MKSSGVLRLCAVLWLVGCSGVMNDGGTDGSDRPDARNDAGKGQAPAQNGGARGGGGATVDAGAAVSWAFAPHGATRPTSPTCLPVEVPELSLGGPVDHVLELVTRLGGPDLRRDLTDLLAGDVGKASSQARAWEQAAASTLAIRDDLARGQATVARSWLGVAADVSCGYTSAWVEALAHPVAESEALQPGHGQDDRIVHALVDAVDASVDVAT